MENYPNFADAIKSKVIAGAMIMMMIFGLIGGDLAFIAVKYLYGKIDAFNNAINLPHENRELLGMDQIIYLVLQGHSGGIAYKISQTVTSSTISLNTLKLL